MKLSDRYLLGPQFFVDSTADVSFLYPVWRDSESFQVIRKFFSSTFEGAVEKIYEAVPIPDREKRTLALPEGYQGRFDTGRGRERSGRNAKVHTSFEIDLDEDGKRSEFFGSRACAYSLCDLSLEKKHAKADEFLFFQYFEQNRGGNGIGEVADDLSGLSLKKVPEFDTEDILLEHGEVGEFPFCEAGD